MKRRGERILGPYAERAGFRVIEIDAAGNRSPIVFTTEAKATRYVELMRAQLSQEERTTEAALTEYKAHLAAVGARQDSIDVVEWAVHLFFPDAVPLALLSAKRCQALYDDIRTRPRQPVATKKPPEPGEPVAPLPPLAADTHRGALSRVRRFLGWCQERGYLRQNPAAGIKGVGKLRPRGKSLGKGGNELRVREARVWYAKAVELASTGDDGAVAALVALLLGMRASEIVSRKVGDLDEDSAPGDLLWIPCSKTPAGRRTLEVPEVLRPLLVACAEGKPRDRHLFEAAPSKRPGVARKPHDRGWIIDQVHRICDAAKVPRVTAHAMRGLLATLTAERGLAGHLIAATLGHEDERVTMTAYAAPGAAAAGVSRRGLVVLEGGARASGESR